MSRARRPLAAWSFFDALDWHFKARAPAFECQAQRGDDGSWACPLAGSDACEIACAYRQANPRDLLP